MPYATLGMSLKKTNRAVSISPGVLLIVLALLSVAGMSFTTDRAKVIT